ncbi:helix-turn-helix transcriptional regulator [Periweissella fabaria]|uniref:HTH cro/C1-type domain-containing protein n=1 Tax=Periweissella fabaria TaxID=546157 RepID=A0ABM8Z3S5_9LACO|nr:helix-turn-helix transcriptional regulator [Periweissella fabaria]MCM0596435.1 helix-turn-helix transcriptional regulator [Periweissella fabaria]CAH0415837.1 hypothetical protein WFA24289_00135 [Periweissella fabaria]
MEFANNLRTTRKALNITQQELADQLHVTRQTLSRWENNQSYPNLDTLVQLSDLLAIPLDSLLKGGDNPMVTKISHDVRTKKRYQRYLLIIASSLLLIVIWLGTLGYGRANQIQQIDRINPFLTPQVGYAILPPTPARDKNGLKVDAFVADDPFGNGAWLNFYTGQYTPSNQWTLVEHKGSYIKHVRLIKQQTIPKIMQLQVGTHFIKYNAQVEPRINKSKPWLPFN